MSSTNYQKATGVIFLIVALGHLVRIIGGISVTFGSTSVPVWASWLAVIVAGYLSYRGLKGSR